MQEVVYIANMGAAGRYARSKNRGCRLGVNIGRTREFFFFFNDTATTEIYTLSLYDALPIWSGGRPSSSSCTASSPAPPGGSPRCTRRSEEHTSELQSHLNLVCRLLLEKKKKNTNQQSPLYRTSRFQQCLQ